MIEKVWTLAMLPTGCASSHATVLCSFSVISIGGRGGGVSVMFIILDTIERESFLVQNAMFHVYILLFPVLPDMLI